MLVNTVQQSKIFQDYLRKQFEKGGTLDDLKEGGSLDDLIDGLKNRLCVLDLNGEDRSLLGEIINEAIYEKNTYYSSTVRGRVSSLFQRIIRKFFGCAGYMTPIEKAEAFLNSVKEMEAVEPLNQHKERPLNPSFEPLKDETPGLVKVDIDSLECRLKKDDAGIVQALQRQAERNAKQMAHESEKRFQYREAPPAWEMHEECVDGVQVGIAHAQGERRTMEDEHIATGFNLQIGERIFPIQLYGIFDGHGGSIAAEYVRDHLEAKLSEALAEYNSTGLTDAGIWRALKMTCVRLNRDFRDQHREIAQKQGTTATIAMVLDQKLWTANVGDSRTILDNGGTAEQLTEDAKPNDPRYRQGIERRNGTVEDVSGIHRVNGVLAVARAIGDHKFNGAISARPKIAVKPLSDIQPGSHLVLCCDGIYDVSRTVDVANAVHTHRQLTPGVLARNIIYSAYEAGSSDNLSALVVKIR